MLLKRLLNISQCSISVAPLTFQLIETFSKFPPSEISRGVLKDNFVSHTFPEANQSQSRLINMLQRKVFRRHGWPANWSCNNYCIAATVASCQLHVASLLMLLWLLLEMESNERESVASFHGIFPVACAGSGSCQLAVFIFHGMPLIIPIIMAA